MEWFPTERVLPWVRQFLAAEGMTVRALATHAGVSEHTLYKCFNGRNKHMTLWDVDALFTYMGYNHVLQGALADCYDGEYQRPKVARKRPKRDGRTSRKPIRARRLRDEGLSWAEVAKKCRYKNASSAYRSVHDWEARNDVRATPQAAAGGSSDGL